MNDYNLARALDAELHEEIEEADEIEESISSPYRWTQAFLLVLGALGLQRVASLAPQVVETFYSRGVYQILGRIVSIINKPFSLSLAEIFAVLLVIGVAVWMLWLIQKVWNGFISPLDLIGYLVYRLLWVGGVVMLLFFVLWGFNYQRLTLAESLNLTGRETAPGELEQLATVMVTRLNENYDAARANQSWSVNTRLPLTRNNLYKVIEESYQRTALLDRASQGGFGPPKPLLLSPMLSRFGISGIFSPFTGEANYNEEVPYCELPFVIAHEKAHQRGFAREDEANFIGFITAIKAADPYVRYSGYLFAVPKILNVLAKTNEEQYRILAARIGEGPRNDIRDRAAFWNRTESPILGEMARQTNNTYLRANRVRSGIANYDEVTGLIISYFQKYPGGDRETVPVPLVNDPPAAATSTEVERPNVRAVTGVDEPAFRPTPRPQEAIPTEQRRSITDTGFIQ